MNVVPVQVISDIYLLFLNILSAPLAFLIAKACNPFCNTRYFQLQFIQNTWGYLTPALIVMGLGVIILDIFLILAMQRRGESLRKSFKE